MVKTTIDPKEIRKLTKYLGKKVTETYEHSVLSEQACELEKELNKIRRRLVEKYCEHCEKVEPFSVMINCLDTEWICPNCGKNALRYP